MISLTFLGVMSLFVSSTVFAATADECAKTHNFTVDAKGRYSGPDNGDYNGFLVCLRKNGLNDDSNMNCSKLFDIATDTTKYTVCRVLKGGLDSYPEGGCTVFAVDPYTGGINIDNDIYKSCQSKCVNLTDSKEKSNCTALILTQNKYYAFQKEQKRNRDWCAEDMKVPTGFAIFNIGNVIPVIPARCFSTALGLELLPNAIGRLYAFIAGIGIYLITTGIIINGVYWVVSGIDNEYNTTTLLKNIRSLFFSVFILLVISTLILNILNSIGYDSTNSNSQTGTGIIFK
jgi:hypothetical protein